MHSRLVNVDDCIRPNTVVLGDELRNGRRVNCSYFEFVESDPNRTVGAPLRAFSFGTNESDIVSAHRSVEVPLTLDRPIFISMVDANAEGTQFDRYPKFFFCFTQRRISDSLARLHTAAGYDPVASTLPQALY